MRMYFEEKLHIVSVPVALSQMAVFYLVGAMPKFDPIVYIGIFIVCYFSLVTVTDVALSFMIRVKEALRDAN